MIYIVGTQGLQVADLARQTGLAATHAVEDTEGVLSDTYHPATLTAVLVDTWTARSPRSSATGGRDSA